MARRRVLADILTLTPSNVESWLGCRRAFLLGHVLGLPASDHGPDPTTGLRVHSLLRMIHAHGSVHDSGHVADVLAGHDADDDYHRALVAGHAARVPEHSEVERHEIDLARFHRVPPPLFMATARIDALWVRDGVLDARDYKTGRVWHLRVADDPRAQVQAWVLAPHARRRGVRLRLRYEHLAPEVDEEPEPWEPSDEDLDAIEEQLRALAEAIRRAAADDDWQGVADAGTCGACRYRSICADSAAPGEPAWPALATGS
jgi:hypothetical protein